MIAEKRNQLDALLAWRLCAYVHIEESNVQGRMKECHLLTDHIL